MLAFIQLEGSGELVTDSRIVAQSNGSLTEISGVRSRVRSRVRPGVWSVNEHSLRRPALICELMIVEMGAKAVCIRTAPAFGSFQKTVVSALRVGPIDDSLSSGLDWGGVDSGVGVSVTDRVQCNIHYETMNCWCQSRCYCRLPQILILRWRKCFCFV